MRSGVAVPAGRPQRPPDGDDRDERDEDAELRLDDRRDDGVDRRALRAVAPQLAQPEQQEDDAERVDLAPHDAVEPGDRVEDGDGRRGEGQPVAPAELADHRPGEPADREVGQDRRDLDEVADAADRVADDPDQPQDVQVAGRVVVEEVAVVEAVEALVARFDAQNRNAPRSTSNPDPGRRRAMMRRRTRPSARTTRTAPTAPCVPVSRVGARVPRSVPPMAGPVTGNGSCTSVEGGSERSTGSPEGPIDGSRDRCAARPCASPAGWRSGSAACSPSPRWRSTWARTSIATTTISCGRPPPSSKARPRSASRSRRRTGSSGNAYFQDVLPVATTDGVARGLLPFPPLPAVVLLPFVALWGLATNDQAIFTVLAALDVAICWWAVGRLPVGLGGPPRDDDLLRVRDRLLVHRPDLDHLVPGAHRRGRPDVPGHRAGRRRGPGRRRSARLGRRGRRVAAARGDDPTPGTALRRGPDASAGALAIDRRQFVAGLLFGLACTARLSVVFGAPFFAFVGSGSGGGAAPGRPGWVPRSRCSASSCTTW